MCDLPHLGFLHPASCDGGRPDTDAAGSSADSTSNGIAFLLTVMPASPSAFSCFASGHSFGKHIHQHQVRVSPAGDDPVAFRSQRFRHHFGVGDYLSERSRGNSAARLPGSRLLSRRSCASAALPACRGTPSYRYLWHTPACSGRRQNVVRERSCAWWRSRYRRAERGWVQRPPATSPEMCAMSTRKTAPTLSAIGGSGRNRDARIGAATADNQFRAFARWPFSPVRRNRLSPFPCYAVRNNLVRLARKIQRMAMGEVATVRQAHAQDCVARLQNGRIHGLVGLAPECGCTLTFSAPKSFLARSRASSSTTSVNSQPP